MTSQPSPSPWDRLQELLLALEPEQTITVHAIVAETELSPETASTVLNCLTKAGLFLQHGDVFVRRSLFRALIAQIALS
jgi:DNA-binding IclR family transcriptional regulator